MQHEALQHCLCAGEDLRVVDVPPGSREWFVPWGDLLTLELRWTTNDPNADRLIVHRKGKPGKGVHVCVARTSSALHWQGQGWASEACSQPRDALAGSLRS